MVPRLSSRIRVALYGDENGIADVDKLEADRLALTSSTRPLAAPTGDFTWRVWSHRFTAKRGSGEKNARRAFEEFRSCVSNDVSRDAAANLATNAAGEAYAALAADDTGGKSRARADLEGAFGPIAQKQWHTVRCTMTSRIQQTGHRSF